MEVAICSYVDGKAPPDYKQWQLQISRVATAPELSTQLQRPYDLGIVNFVPSSSLSLQSSRYTSPPSWSHAHAVKQYVVGREGLANFARFSGMPITNYL